MFFQVCCFKNAGVAGYVKGFETVQLENRQVIWCSYLEIGVLDSAPCFSLGIVYTVRGAAKRHEICQI